MFLKFYPILYTLIFTGVLEIAVLQEGFFFKALFFLVLFSLLVVWPLAKKFRFLAIPFFLSVGSLQLLYLIDSLKEKQVFILLSAVVYYLSILGAYRLKLYERDQTAQGMINVCTIATAFFWYTSTYGWYLNFQIGAWALVATFIGSTFLITWPSLHICAAGQMKKKKELQSRTEPISCLSQQEQHCLNISSWVILFLNFIVGLIMAQVIWGLSLWPFGYLTTGVVALIIYFIFWDIIRNYVQGTFYSRWILFNIFLAVFSIAGILMTAQWHLVA